MPNEEDKTITFQYSYFLREILLGQLDRTAVDIVAARIIHATDPDGIQAHVQFESQDDVPLPLDKPVVWWRKDWDLDYKRYCNQKEKEAADRLVRVKRSENIKNAAKLLQKKYNVSEESAARIALLMIQKNDLELVKALGGNPEE